jgi:hypothetical protein
MAIYRIVIRITLAGFADTHCWPTFTSDGVLNIKGDQSTITGETIEAFFANETSFTLGLCTRKHALTVLSARAYYVTPFFAGQCIDFGETASHCI